MLETESKIQPPENLHAFAPSAGRVFFLDRRMRLRLRDSLAYIWNQAAGRLALPPERFQQFLVQLENHPISPLAFSFYSDVVIAIEADDLDQANALLDELIRLPVHAGGTVISALADPKSDRTAARYARFIDTDPSITFEIFPPSTVAAANGRAQIESAFELMAAGDPELAAEIWALLREIILAAGSEDPQAMTFDGASSFMLWGTIIINANQRADVLAMVQMLAHESAHNLLFGLSADESLVENSPDELFSSPLRHDPRPMDGIYHATFVTARMYRSVKRLLASGVLSAALQEKALEELAANARLFQQGIATVNQYAKLTPLGAAVMKEASAYMAANS